MNLAIDPDVFRASFHEFPCQAALFELGAEIWAHRFFQDQDATIEQEYRLIFNEKYVETDHPAIRVLQYILFEDGNPEDRLSAKSHLRDQVERLGCSTPVEPELIGMLANARDLGLVLLMIGNETRHGRPRGLYDPELFRAAGKIIPWLDVRWAGRSITQIPHSMYLDDAVWRIKTTGFEPKVALWLQDNDQVLKCCTPPLKGEIGGEQIDVYGYRRTDSGVTVVVGECKLRHEGNEVAKPVERKEIQQLRRKLIAARCYEAAKKRRPATECTPILFEGILISNAADLEDEAKELIDQEPDLRLRFLKVTLQKGWEARQEWRILAGQWLYPLNSAAPFSEEPDRPLRATVRD